MKTVGYLPRKEKAKETNPKDGGSKEAEKKADGQKPKDGGK